LTERARIDSSGRLGLGTSSPGTDLHIRKDQAAFTGIYLENRNTSAGSYSGISFGTNGAGTNQWFITRENQTTANLDFALTLGSPTLSLAPTGRVGIGTTSPGANLEIKSASIPAIRLNQADTYYAPIKLAGNDLEIRGSSGTIEFYNGANNGDSSTERARIDSSGRLLVGTYSSSKNCKLVIQGSSATNSSIVRFCRADATPGANDELSALIFGDSNQTDAAYILVNRDGGTWTSGSSHPSRLVFSTTADGASSPTERLRLSQNGEFISAGIYNFTTSNAANVYIFSSGELRRSTSSGKYKTNVETLEDTYSDALLSCRPVWYRSTCDKDNPDWGWWGFIAEEVAEIDPRLVHWKTSEVTYDQNGSAVETPCDPEPEGVAYDRFVPHLLNLIKRQGEAIAELQAEVAALKGS
jgi:hypothetical protein